MNRGVLQSSVMQQMMGSENPSWWNMMNSGTIRTTTTQQSSPNFLSPNNNSPNFVFPHSSLPFPSNFYYDIAQDQLPESWSQLLLGGLVGEDDQKCCMGMFQPKKLEDWEEEILNSNNNNNTQHQQQQVDVKKENSAQASSCTYVYGHGGGGGGGVGGDDYQLFAPKQNSWSPMIPASSPQSCVTSFSSNMLDFSNNNNSPADSRPRHPPPDRSSECNSNATGGAVKKARVQSSSNQTTFKVRKEKLGDRITALHQLVSPFGKTDTASVLLEAIGYIRFLQSQIEALSLPYLGNTSGSTRQQQQQHSVQGERNCVFPEDPGQLMNENCLKRKGVSEQDEEPKKDLRSRGLCLVPVSCTLQVGSDNGADYWAPAFGGGCFR